MKYYLAYGSNLSLSQMSYRCPHAVPVAKGFIEGYRLKYKGSHTGSYLTIEPEEGCSVPVVVWIISPEDEANLDRYEGCPRFYYKKTLPVTVEPLFKRRRYEIKALVYIMHEDHLCGVPANRYVATCAEGYERFGLPLECLDEAYRYTLDHLGEA